jgi:hypothetical protein
MVGMLRVLEYNVSGLLQICQELEPILSKQKIKISLLAESQLTK